MSQEKKAFALGMLGTDKTQVKVAQIMGVTDRNIQRPNSSGELLV